MTRVCDAHVTEVKRGCDAPYGPKSVRIRNLQSPNIIFGGAPLEVVYHLVEASMMSGRPQSRFRLLGAWVCLLAVASLFAPLAGAAWSTSAMDCCTGDHCTIPKHHHHKAAAHLNCDHDNAGGRTECSMSCCQDEERFLATAMIFVMPLLAMSSAPLHVTPALEASRSIEIPRSVQPLVPPPRSIASV
jgi:hypothetical protein